MPRPASPVTASDYPATVPLAFRERRAVIENAHRATLREIDARHARAVREAIQEAARAARAALRPGREEERRGALAAKLAALDTLTAEYLEYCRMREGKEDQCTTRATG